MKLKRLTTTIVGVSLIAACLGSFDATAAGYPDKTVKLVVPVAPGGSIDSVTRLLAEYLRLRLHGNFIVENRPGANTQIGSRAVSRAAPDGYTLLVNTDAIVTSSLQGSASPLDAARDLKPVSIIVSSPAVLVVRPDFASQTLAQFLAHAKAKSLNVASTGTGTASQFTGLMFKQKAGLEWADIPFSGSAPAMEAMLGGNVDAMWAMAAPVLPYVKAGKLKVLAVTSTQPTAELPHVPTVAATFPGFVVTNWTALFAPPDTPDDIVRLLSKTIADMMKDPAERARFQRLGFTPVGSDPATLRNEIDASLARWRAVLAR